MHRFVSPLNHTGGTRMSDKTESKSKELSKTTQNGSVAKNNKEFNERLNRNKERLLAEANASQQKLFRALIGGVPHAIAIGQNLIALTGLVPRGSYLEFVAENFCKPNGIGIRTAQRYCLLARSVDRIFDRLRIANPQLEHSSIAKLLDELSITEALFLIRQLVSNQAVGEPVAFGIESPKPDQNDWFTPLEIIDRVLTLMGVVDFDPCVVPGTNPLLAIRAISKPTDSLAEDCDWTGKVFINPGLQAVPHSKFVERTLFEFNRGNLQEALILLPACTNAKYAALLRAYPRAFTNRPLIVSGPALPKRMIRQPLMLVFVSPEDRWSAFVNAFNDPSTFDLFSPVIVKN